MAQDTQNEIHDEWFSPDARWLLFSMTAVGRRRDLYLYEIATAKLTRLGSGDNIDANPVWSPDGKYLYFTSARHENAVGSDIELDFAILKTTGVYGIALAKDTASPVAPLSDEADTGKDADDSDDSAASDSSTAAVATPAKPPKPGDRPPPDKPGAKPPIRIDLDGLMARAVALPIDPANITQIDARDDRVFYLVQPLDTIGGVLPGEGSELHFYDFKKRKDVVVTDDVDAYSLSGDGERVLIKHDHDYTVLDTKADAAKDDDTRKKLDLAHMRLLVDPAQEWAEMFDNAWRLERDLFVIPEMNGVDWKAVHDNYARLLPLAGSREDLNYLIGQMIGEISNSHTYVGDGDDGETAPQVRPGLLGVDWALDAASGRYRIATLYPGDNTRDQYRSPLAQPGLAVKAGDYVLAINGVDLRAPTVPGWRCCS